MGDEPNIALPMGTLILGQLVTALAVTVLWVGIGLLMGDAWLHLRAAAVGAGIVTVAAIVTTIIGLPWIPKAASTALLAWLACSMLRMVASPGLALLLYSAPFAGRPETLTTARTSLLLALATTFLVGLLVEVVLVARHLRRTGPN